MGQAPQSPPVKAPACPASLGRRGSPSSGAGRIRLFPAGDDSRPFSARRSAMKLQEYRSTEILARYGVPLLPGETATSPEEARAAAQRIAGAVVVKAQVLVGGRGKAGGVKLAATPQEAEARAREIIGLEIKGVTVRTVLVAPAAEIAKEYYLGLILDRAAKAVTVIASAE